MQELNRQQRQRIEGEAPGTLTGAGAINPLKKTTYFTSTGSNALTLADGTYYGQRVTIVHISDGGSGTITQTSGAKLTASLARIVLANAYESVTLEWDGSVWNPIVSCPVAVAVAS